MSYDHRCHNLAEVFVTEDPDTKNHPDIQNIIAELAQRIQDTIEDFLHEYDPTP